MSIEGLGPEVFWGAVGAIATIVALLLSVPATITAVIALVTSRRQSMQLVLDKIPTPPSGIDLLGDYETQLQFAKKYSLDDNDIGANLAVSDDAVYACLKRLVRMGKVCVFHPDGYPNSEGSTQGYIPMYFKGPLPKAVAAREREWRRRV
jgi:hypothetical protein